MSLHRSATTTEAVRRAIQHSQESMRALARRHGINPKTVAKWKKRESTAEDGERDGLGDLVDHADGDGLDGGAGEAAGDVGDAGAAGLGVEGEEGVDEGEGVGAGVGGGAGHEGDGGDVGGELDDDGAVGDGAGAADELVEERGVGAEDHAAVGGVGAGGVELVEVDAGGVVEDADNLDAVLDGKAEDVSDDAEAGDAAEAGHLLLDEGVDAHILEADGVDHAGGCLDDAGRGVAGHGSAGEILGDEGADAVEGEDVLELDAVAEGAAGGDDGGYEVDAGEVDAHVGGHRDVVGCDE